MQFKKFLFALPVEAPRGSIKNFAKYTLIALLLSVWATSLFATNPPTTDGPDCQCPQVTGLSATSTVLSLTVSWTTDPTFSSYIVQVFKPSSPAIYFQTTSTGSSATIHGTSPSTTYRVKVVGVCGDFQANGGTINVTTVPAPPLPADCRPGDAPETQAGAWSLGAGISDPITGDQIEVEGDIDAYYFWWYAECGYGSRTISLNSMSNDYELTVSFDSNVLPGGKFSASSTNPGTTSESITFSMLPGEVLPKKVFVYVAGAVPTSYNTYDCYFIGGNFLPCLPGGGEEASPTGSNGGLTAVPDLASLQLSVAFDEKFEFEQEVSIQVLSTQGQLVLNESTQVLKGENQIKVDIPGLSPGIYFVNATGSFGKKSQKFVVAQ